ncbi:hypothetical protein ACH42_05145 [Endozoicomonas sp. (ex Bugula neritina AB1)]|nr:hypothetical protein ACH42_05145 [Endozoicomonas sp. (ex Bugula neritina AB1)]
MNLQSRIQKIENTTNAMDDCVANFQDPTGLTNYKPRIPYYENFQNLANTCSNLCTTRDVECKGYITGSFIDPEESTDPEQLLKKLMPSYSKYDDETEDDQRKVDCICVKEKDIKGDIPEFKS